MTYFLKLLIGLTECAVITSTESLTSICQKWITHNICSWLYMIDVPVTAKPRTPPWLMWSSWWWPTMNTWHQNACVPTLAITTLISRLCWSVLSLSLSITDTMVCTGCCATLDNIITYLFKRLTRKQKKPSPSQPQDSEAFLRILEMHPEVLQQVCFFWTEVTENKKPLKNIKSTLKIK